MKQLKYEDAISMVMHDASEIAEKRRIAKEALERQKAEEKRRREAEAARKAEEERRIREEAARKAAEEQRRKKEEAARKAAEEQRRKAEEKARKEEEERRAREKRERKEKRAKAIAAIFRFCYISLSFLVTIASFLVVGAILLYDYMGYLASAWGISLPVGAGLGSGFIMLVFIALYVLSIILNLKFIRVEDLGVYSLLGFKWLNAVAIISFFYIFHMSTSFGGAFWYSVTAFCLGAYVIIHTQFSYNENRSDRSLFGPTLYRVAAVGAYLAIFVCIDYIF